jgi:hypothetical protein
VTSEKRTGSNDRLQTGITSSFSTPFFVGFLPVVHPVKKQMPITHHHRNNKQAIQLLHCRRWLFICKITVNSLANHPLTSTASSATSITSFPPPATPQITLEASGNTEQSPVRSPLSTKKSIRILRLYSSILDYYSNNHSSHRKPSATPQDHQHSLPGVVSANTYGIVFIISLTKFNPTTTQSSIDLALDRSPAPNILITDQIKPQSLSPLPRESR